MESTEMRWQRHVDQGRRFVSQGNYAEAEQSLLAAVKEALTLGPADLRVASSLGVLGKLKHRQGDRTRAQGFLERALAVREEALGPDHYGVVPGLNDLAALHYSYGNLEEARALYERALSIAEKRLAPDHADLALALYNLSRAHFKSGNHLRAEPLLTRLLAIKERTLGPEHTDVAAILTALSRVRSMAGRHDEAEAMARRALEIREHALAPDDPAIAVSLELVAYFCAGRAKRMRSLADAERILGGARGTSAPGESTAESDADALATELAALAAEEKSLRERAREIRSRSGGNREPSTLERSPAADGTPAVHGEAAPTATETVHAAGECEAATVSEVVQVPEVAAGAAAASGGSADDDAGPLVVLHNCYAADAAALGLQSSVAQAERQAVEEPVAHAVVSEPAVQAVVSEPAVHAVVSEPAVHAAEEYASVTAELSVPAQDVCGPGSAATAEYEDSPVTDAEYIPAVIVPPGEVADAPIVDEDRQSIADSLPSVLSGRRVRWFLGIAAIALTGAGAAGFALGRGARESEASSFAQVQQASRGSIEDPQAGSIDPGAAAQAVVASDARIAAHGAAPDARDRAPRIPDWNESAPRARRAARIPSLSQAHRMTRTMEQLGAKVMVDVDSRVDSIARTVELPPTTFGKP